MSSLFSTVALCKLLQHGLNTNDKRLQDIVVKGEELFGPDEGIRTRSKSAKSKTNTDILFVISCLSKHFVEI